MNETSDYATIEEARALRLDLEREIDRLIKKFELATGLNVVEISIDGVPLPNVQAVRIKVEL